MHVAVRVCPSQPPQSISGPTPESGPFQPKRTKWVASQHRRARYIRRRVLPAGQCRRPGSRAQLSGLSYGVTTVALHLHSTSAALSGGVIVTREGRDPRLPARRGSVTRPAKVALLCRDACRVIERVPRHFGEGRPQGILRLILHLKVLSPWVRGPPTQSISCVSTRRIDCLSRKVSVAFTKRS